ncbi:MAG: glycoside hydrolase family 57 protein [Candidatus Heimdallarchaeota archaeon]|nr:glycoside hydrolase family 57 protein [Candidatus Heimdallarchaeota archaeon]
MPTIVFYFQVHQPYRLNQNFRRDRFYKNSDLTNLEALYFTEDLNKDVMQRVAKKCYLPANKTWLDAIDEYKKSKKKVKIAFSITGTLLEQAERYQPDVIDSFKQLAETNCVEFIGETYFHSLTSIYGVDKTEFIEQVKMHSQLMKDLFGKTPTSFRNTELILNDSIMKAVADLGFKVIMGEGIEHILPKGSSPNYVFTSRKTPSLKILLRNYKLSDDIAFRFGSGRWEEYPLYADKYASWIASTPGDCINIFMDYESLGEHLWAESGIFEFLQHLPKELFKYENITFKTPSETIETLPAVNSISIDDFSTISWADDRDVGAWLRNPLQNISFDDQKFLEKPIKQLNNPSLLKIWRMLTTSDHLYYISQADAGPGEVHSYFSHYNTPIEAFANYNEIISDLTARTLMLLNWTKK